MAAEVGATCGPCGPADAPARRCRPATGKNPRHVAPVNDLLAGVARGDSRHRLAGESGNRLDGAAISDAGLRHFLQADERLRAAAAGVDRHLCQLDESRQPVRATGPANRLAGVGHPQRNARHDRADACETGIRAGNHQEAEGRQREAGGRSGAKQPAKDAKPQHSPKAKTTKNKKRKAGRQKPAAEATPEQPAKDAKPQDSPESSTVEKSKADREKPPAEAPPKQPAGSTKKPPELPKSAAVDKPPAEGTSKQPAKDAKPKEPAKPAEPPKSVPAEPPKSTPAESPRQRRQCHPSQCRQGPKSQISEKVAQPPSAVQNRPGQPGAAVLQTRVAERPARSSEPAAAAPSRSVARAASQSREPERPGTEASSAGTVEIKADELSASISGSNLAFRAIEAELNEKGVWTAARLEPLAEQLKILVIRRHDLHLFREAVPEDKRASIERLASAEKRGFAVCGLHRGGSQSSQRRRFQGDGCRASDGVEAFGRAFPPAGGIREEIGGGAVLNWTAILSAPPGWSS